MKKKFWSLVGNLFFLFLFDSTFPNQTNNVNLTGTQQHGFKKKKGTLTIGLIKMIEVFM